MLIRLELVRELHPHFPKNADEMSSHTDNDQTPHWHLLGANDFLLATKIDSLPMLGEIYGGGNENEPKNQTHKRSTTITPGGVQEWVLCDPFSNDSLLIENAFATLSQKEGGPILIIAASFSSVFFDKLKFLDIDNRSNEITETIKKITETIKELLARRSFSSATVLSSIGGMDLTLIIPIENKPLTDAYRVLQELRDLKSFNDVKYHHYFSQVNAFFCFKDHQKLTNHAQDEIKIISRTRTVCGHQRDFLAGEGPNTLSYLTMGTYSVTQIFDGLSSLAELGTLAMNQERHFEACQAGFDGRRTEIAFPANQITTRNLADQGNHSKITLTDELDNFGKLIDSAVTTLTGNDGSVTGREIAKVLLAVKKSINRNERLGALRDLFPFISQLCYCINSTTWKNFFPYPNNLKATTMSSALALTTHLWRAIRNRIESRVESLDPSFPGTLDSGISKLLNGYSVAAWLCSGMFNASNQHRACTTDSFAACVAAGYSGRIQTQEIFADLRRLKENISPITNVDDVRRIEQDNPQTGGNWNSRLLLLDISGRAIFRPEIAFLHCIHEIAEFTEWWANPNTSTLRSCVNQFQLTELAGKLLNTPALSMNFGVNDTQKRKDVDFSIKLMKILASSRNLKFDTEDDKIVDSVQTVIREEVSKKLDPTWFFITILDELSNLDTDNKELLGRLLKIGIEQSLMTKIKSAANQLLKSELIGTVNTPPVGCVPSQSKNNNQDLLDKAFPDEASPDKIKKNSLLQTRDQLREIIADFSMLYAYSRIRKSVSDSSEIKLYQSDVDYTFGCLVEQTASWLPAVVPDSKSESQSSIHVEKLRDIVYRWLIQKHVVNHVSKIQESKKRKAEESEKEKADKAEKEKAEKEKAKKERAEEKEWHGQLVRDLTYTICLFDKRGQVNENFKKLVQSLIHQCIIELSDKRLANTTARCLAFYLAEIIHGNAPLIDSEFVRSDPAKSILKEFIELWNVAKPFSMSVRYKLHNHYEKSPGVNDSDIKYKDFQNEELRSTVLVEQSRTGFAWTLWAKSQKLCFQNCFQEST